MRLFLSVNLPASVSEAVVELQQKLKTKIKDDKVSWSKPEQFHLTLKFLGEVDYRKAGAVVDTAVECVKHTKPFEIALSGLGAFPSNDRPSVLWVGITEGMESVRELASSLDDQLAEIGIRKERNDLKPHITLARIKSYTGEAAAKRVMASFREEVNARFTVGNLALMRSDLSPTGSIYAVVDEFPFRGADEPAMDG